MRTTQSILAGVIASMLLGASTSALAAEDKPAYLLDKSGSPVLAKSGGCVATPKQNKDKMFEICGDVVDSDGDGVMDDKDKCPNTPKGVKVDANGCPLDADGDGVPDYKDKCPNNTAAEIAAGVNADGCPIDSDGDGVPDYKDKCPGTPAGTAVDSDGCATVTKVLKTTLSDTKEVNFAFDKANLNAAGKTKLNKVAQVINSDLSHVKEVQVIGHTDSTGPAAYNQGLSEKRAKSVGNYLRSQGVPDAKIKETGLGESKPEVPNNTRANRAKNRRVEINILKTNK